MPAGIEDRPVAYPVTAAPVAEAEAILAAAYRLTPFAEHESAPSEALGTAMFGWLGRT
jgi:hypothetical protein